MVTTVLDRHQNRPITAHSTKILLIKYRSFHFMIMMLLIKKHHDHA